MKKISTSLVLIVLLMQVMGYFLVFRLRQMEIREEMKAFLHSKPDHEYVSSFRFRLINGEVTDPLMQWSEKNEFSYKGELYDVVSIEESGNELIIRGINDERETALLSEFEKMASQQQSSSKSRTDSLIQLLSDLYFSGRDQSILHPRMVSRIRFPLYHTSFPFNIMEILTPPPRFFC